MQINLVGINHHTAPITIREKMAVSTEQLPYYLSLLRYHIPQGVILSTCNRTEIYTIDTDGKNAREAILGLLKERLGTPTVDLYKHLYFLEDEEAMGHLFRVASGLDSMIVGEYEILGQVKNALDSAEEMGMVDLPLRHVFQSAIRVGRLVRQKTGISKNAISVSSLAVDLAVNVVGNLKKSKILVVGTGEAGRLVLKVARERGATQIVIASRRQERAAELAATIGGTPTSLSHLNGELSTCNIVITCANADNWMLKAGQVAEIMVNRPELPLVIIDIGVPRNVEPEVQQIDNVFLHNIDDLNDIARLNHKSRQAEVQNVEEIIAVETDRFAAKWQALQVSPVVTALMQKAEDIRSTQLKRTLKKLPPLSEEERFNLEAMTKSIITKVLDSPVQYLRADRDGNYTELVRELFQLDTEIPR